MTSSMARVFALPHSVRARPWWSGRASPCQLLGARSHEPMPWSPEGGASVLEISQSARVPRNSLQPALWLGSSRPQNHARGENTSRRRSMPSTVKAEHETAQDLGDRRQPEPGLPPGTNPRRWCWPVQPAGARTRHEIGAPAETRQSSERSSPTGSSLRQPGPSIAESGPSSSRGCHQATWGGGRDTCDSGPSGTTFTGAVKDAVRRWIQEVDRCLTTEIKKKPDKRAKTILKPRLGSQTPKRENLMWAVRASQSGARTVGPPPNLICLV